jgi:hypothetical protein
MVSLAAISNDKRKISGSNWSDFNLTTCFDKYCSAKCNPGLIHSSTFDSEVISLNLTSKLSDLSFGKIQVEHLVQPTNETN